MKLLQQYPDELKKLGGTMGFLKEETHSNLAHHHMLGADAFLLLTQDDMAQSPRKRRSATSVSLFNGLGTYL